MKKIIASAIILLTISTAFAQTNQKADKNKIIREQAGRPDVPGDLKIDFGLNLLQNNEWDHGTFGSKFFNIYYQYGFNIGNSAFSFHPGLGIGTEKYDFDDKLTLVDSIGSNFSHNVIFKALDDVYDSTATFKKSKLAVTYLDVPLELRWRSLKYDPQRSVKVALGVKVGLKLDSHMKVKYDHLGETIKVKEKNNFGVSGFRYGTYGKFGYGKIYAYYYYSLSKLFENGEGPNATEAFPMQVGLTLSLF